MSFLVDTDVLSLLRRRERHPALADWLAGLEDDGLFLSVVTIGEIERGVALKRASDPIFADALTDWLDVTIRVFGDRVLDVTPAVARAWGRLSAEVGHGGADLLIAATARVHGLTVVTRNVRHFAPAGVDCFDPLG